MWDNCNEAKRFATLLNLNMPDVNWYVPAEHEDFVHIAYLKGYITNEQILDVDCAILEGCDGLLVFKPDGFISNGMKIEIDWASAHCVEKDGSPGLPTHYTDGCDWSTIKVFVSYIKGE